MSSSSERAQRAWRPLWRVTINGQVFDGRYNLPTDAIVSAMRKFLAGPRRRMSDGIECWERRAPPAAHEECIGIIEIDGAQVWLVPILSKAQRDEGDPLRRNGVVQFIETARIAHRDSVRNQMDPKSGAPPHALHDDYAIFVERLPEKPGTQQHRYFELREQAAREGKLGFVFDAKGNEQ